MPVQAHVALFRQFVNDDRGSEMMETIAKVAFIGLPILALCIWAAKTYMTKAESDSSDMADGAKDVKASRDTLKGMTYEGGGN